MQPVEKEIAKQRADAIRELSRQRYAVPREEVEAALKQHWEESVTPGKAKSVKEKSHSTITETTKIEMVAADIEKDPKQQKQSIEPLKSAAPKKAVSVSTQPAKDIKPVEKKTQAPTREEKLSGRGGKQHKYLQHLIVKWAQSKGWLATIEQPVLDGAGFIDVALERDLFNVACEVTVTTPVDYELGNIEKCLKADFQHVLMISSESKHLNKIRQKAVHKFSEAELRKVHFLSPEDAFSFLEKLEAKMAGGEQNVRGYNVKVNYQALDNQQKSVKKEALGQVIMNRMKRNLKED